MGIELEGIDLGFCNECVAQVELTGSVAVYLCKVPACCTRDRYPQTLPQHGTCSCYRKNYLDVPHEKSTFRRYLC